MNFDQAFELLIMPVREGGYQDGRGDPGGETKFGISKRSYPREDILNLTKERAKAIYQVDYWSPACCDLMPAMVRFSLFDCAVNTGPTQAKKLLQRAVGATEDGQIGPRTLMAVSSMPEWRVAVRLEAYLQVFRTDRGNWPNASRGWTRRSSANLLEL